MQLWRWDEDKRWDRLILFSFFTGLSFTNHLQTVMLAPAVLFLVTSGDRKALLDVRRFLLLACFFALALSLYIYLPIRTEAGAAIHWGDPNTLERFIAHVTARTHRAGYVLSKTPGAYLERAMDAGKILFSQFGVLLFLSVWGWITLTSIRWRIFFFLVVLFDLTYTVFLNIIFLDITPFNLPTCIVLAVLMGNGLFSIMKFLRKTGRDRPFVDASIRTAAFLTPLTLFTFSYTQCDQSQNYIAHEHALNIFRTLDDHTTLIVEDDNNVFPILYGRVVEGMRPDVTLYDRQNILFKMPYVGQGNGVFIGKWQDLNRALIKGVVEKTSPGGLYFAIFSPLSIQLPDGYAFSPEGILYRVIPTEHYRKKSPMSERVWTYYVSTSLEEDFSMDYMNRQICGFFYFAKARYLIRAGRRRSGIQMIRKASKTAHNDLVLHSDLGVFLTDHGYFQAAKRELEIAFRFHKDLSGVYNNWGYYFQKKGDYRKALEAFEQAIDLNGENPMYYNNLALLYLKIGNEGAALRAFRQSLNLNTDQPGVKRLIKRKGLETDNKVKAHD
jgi:tetratricopeptide (TPR) repeat protein